MGNVSSIYKAMAKREINRALQKYGKLPGFLLADLAEVKLNTAKYALGCWEGLAALPIASQEFQTVVNSAVEEGKGMVQALEELIVELKRDYDNEIPYTNI